MFVWGILVGFMVVFPRLTAASDLGPLAPLQPIGTGIMSAAYLFGAVGIAWCGYHVIPAFRRRDAEGMGPVFEWIGITVLAAVFIGVIVQGLIAPIVAQGATP
jgi:hypothetical protein